MLNASLVTDIFLLLSLLFAVYKITKQDFAIQKLSVCLYNDLLLIITLKEEIEKLKKQLEEKSN